MIYTVTFNPSLDYIVDVDNFRIGHTNRTTKEIMFAGGKGINVSIVLRNLGFENTALGFLAGFTGDEIRRLLSEQQVHSDFIQINEGKSRINLKLRNGQETGINGMGPAIAAEHIERLYEQLDTLGEGDILALSGSIPSCMPKTMYRDIMARLDNRGIKIVVDATQDLLMNVLPYGPFLVKPNNHELGDIFDAEIEDHDTALVYARKLQEQGARNVLVSMAGKGAVLKAEDGTEYRTLAPHGTVVNSVGAGDSTVAGFIAGYLETGSYERAFQMGVCAGSASAFSEGLATREQVEALMGATFR